MALFLFGKIYQHQFCRIKQCTRILSCRMMGRLDLEDDDHFKFQSRVDIGSQEHDDIPLQLNDCFPGGFSFDFMDIYGPIVVLPTTVLKWNVKSIADVNESSFSLFKLLHPKIDLIVLGTGDEVHLLPTNIKTELSKQGFKIAIEGTEHACGTYNILKQEQHKVAACLLPITKKRKAKLLGGRSPIMINNQ